MNDERRSLLPAFAISLICHALLLWFMPHGQGRPAPPEQRTPFAVRLAPPTVPAPAPVPPAEPVPQPVAKSPPASPRRAPALAKSAPSPVVIAPAPAVEEPPLPSPPSPPRHQMKAASGRSAGGGRSAARQGGGSGSVSVYAPPDYAEKVKTRVNAAIVYPADAKRFLQQCWVEYTLTVDRNGNMLNYRIENCGDDRLDAAAQAALIKGGPYPPPPDSGAASYEIHGALVFTLQ